MILQDYIKLSIYELREIVDEEKRRAKAIVLAHNYTRPEIQQLADYIGDSLDLSRKAACSNDDIIVFCGVMFMAETAKILAPDKLVLTPEPNAGCPLAAGATMEDVIEMRRRYPEHVFIAYVNTTAEVKASVDICCTSANAVEVVRSLGEKPVVFLPDRNLGSYVQRKLRKNNMILWGGGCYVHQFISLEDIELARKEFPEWKIIVHPECPPDVAESADLVASTGGMFRWVSDHNEPALLGTEIGMIERINREMPEKQVKTLKENAVCSNMKQITLAKLARTLKESIFEVKLDEEIISMAQKTLKRMIEIG